MHVTVLPSFVRGFKKGASNKSRTNRCELETISENVHQHSPDTSFLELEEPPLDWPVSTHGLANGEEEWRSGRVTHILPVTNLDNNFDQLLSITVLLWWSIQTTNL